MYFLARSAKLKGLAGSSGISAVFGITEPAIFGVKAMALGAAGFIGVVSMRASDMGTFVLSFAAAYGRRAARRFPADRRSNGACTAREARLR